MAHNPSRLAKMGLKVGLMDADIYGPSVPIMFDVHEKPTITTQRKLEPIQKYGVHLVSMGFLIDPDQAMIWRGPMVQSALTQMLDNVAWGELDVIIVDLPPGTGDIQISLAQQVNDATIAPVFSDGGIVLVLIGGFDQ